MLRASVALLPSIVASNPPFDQETIDKPRREQIVANVAAALAFLGTRYEFD
jgi:hypothetical protein